MSAPAPIKPQDVGWQFVPQYYNFVNSQPHRLHCFYNKRSTFIHGEEGEDVTPAYGQQEIHDRIKQIGYNRCKVYIHSMDSQSSAEGGIVIMVLGELCNNNQAWRKFSQTFFLAPQTGGYFVLNDIFRYLNEEVDEQKSEDGHQEEAQLEPEAPKAAVEEPPAAEEKVTQEPAAEPVPEPEPVTAPAAVVPDAVPEEAKVAALPDKDVAPAAEPTPEEPATAANPAVEDTPAPAPASEKAPSPAPKAPSPAPAPNKEAATNGTATPAPAPAPAPTGPPKPRTWATLAASNIPPTSTWGKPSPAVSAQASPSAAAAPVPSAPKKEEQKGAPAPAAAAAPAPRRGPQGGLDVSKIQNQVCFVKLPNWALDNHSASELTEPELSRLASKFGEVKSVEIVGQKACAFVEFAKVESARKAIQHSLPVEQGGEGGTKFPNGTLFFEPRKEKDERGQKKRTGGQQGGQPQGQGQPRQQVNGGGAGRGGRPNRGRGGQANQGDRAPQKQ
ncbi:hypothetical protein, variant [Cryptococcus amylolentus CBS 6039]|uniref:NTF2 domain-containing protein n=1 Tax=Cryptococcus amylolentus CBS 6039 TaxID=1295533 RepID=A0A1E3I864_9TREE|nr:hypothetical protein, variant [Cryptococcus amylolentus CBS 6039]ODN84752.1 hypothetical protein, variant [Cryptococcus amylolentus CBS 6039]